jgi:hypothetical protein
MSPVATYPQVFRINPLYQVTELFVCDVRRRAMAFLGKIKIYFVATGQFGVDKLPEDVRVPEGVTGVVFP